MKNIYYLVFMLISMSCSKKETINVFEALPEERIGVKLEELQNKLLESPYGWKVSLPTSGSGGYGFYMDFHEDQTVDMFADLNIETAAVKGTSTYRIKWVMYPTLLFDTYNYITMLQDPTSDVYGGESGSGLKSDVEFEYLRSTPDSIILRGKKYQNELILIKASQEDKTRFEEGKYGEIIESYQEFFVENKNNYILINKDGVDYKVGVTYNHSAKTFAYEALELDESISTGASKFAYTIQGIEILTDLTYGGVTLKRGLIKQDGKLYLYDADGNEYMVFQNANPLTPLKFLFNYNGTYKSIKIEGPDLPASLPAGVTSSFNTVYDGMVTRFSYSNRVIESVEFSLLNSTTAKVNIWYYSGTTRFLADASFTYIYENGIITLSNYTPSVSNSNWNSRISQIGNFVNWLQSGPFRVDWVVSSDPSVEGIGGLYRVDDASSFFYGKLQ
ncbi:DUF4302 domain-containing protein [Sphingobacterium sp. SGG-5]|uniref:DUF4302 domain-containing protein n=1 Tax=Sphingobacterium sp. SGG-5 TaxID=2710881 RepID=UPI0013E9C9E8|nr:DUF4302 domain-containing protein [Sphingobacterium sp. SGG-5]NGM60545.1 DUF4302 domain-containing protein [Sphingobacterium sp. SGG-5]